MTEGEASSLATSRRDQPSDYRGGGFQGVDALKFGSRRGPKRELTVDFIESSVSESINVWI